MKKKEFLKQINDGFERGAKRKLAKMLNIDPANITEWFNGRSKPSEQNVQKMAGLFSIDEQELWDMFNNTEEKSTNVFQNSGNIKGQNINIQTMADARLALVEKDVEILKKEIEILKLKINKE